LIRSGGTDCRAMMVTIYVMARYRYRVGAALLVAPPVLAACATREQPSVSTPRAADDAVVSPSPGPQIARLGAPFRYGSFEVTVTKVETGVRQLDIAADAKARGLRPWTPKNGQYVLVDLTARNTGNVPTFFSTTKSVLVDEAGATYDSVTLVGGPSPVGQGLGGDNLRPGTSGSGFIVFDVPTSAATPVTLVVYAQIGDRTSAPLPATVRLRS
jgi:hypothetical protein